MIIYANPTTKKAPRKKRKASTRTARRRVTEEAPMATKRRRTATKKKATRRRRVAVHRNPTMSTRSHHRKTHRRRRVHRNPSFLPKGGVLGEILSKDGLMMIGGAFIAPMAADFIQEKIMPSATGWTKIAVKAAIIGGGAWAIDKFLKQRKAALAFAVTGAAVLASDSINLYRGKMAGLSDAEADYLATRPELMQAYASGGSLGDPWQVGLSDPYRVGMADAFAPAFG